MNKGKFLKKYTKQMTSIMLTLNPTWDKKEVEKEIESMIDESCTNPEVILDNNYTGESRESTLLSVLDWVLERKPIIAGNGTFYKNQHEAFNPIAKMLENFLAKRKYYKKLMFSVKDARDPKYSDYDRKQLNEKTRTNSYYGASGMPSSPFFSKWSGPRVVVGPNLSNCWKLSFKLSVPERNNLINRDNQQRSLRNKERSTTIKSII